MVRNLTIIAALLGTANILAPSVHAQERSNEVAFQTFLEHKIAVATLRMQECAQQWATVCHQCGVKATPLTAKSEGSQSDTASADRDQVKMMTTALIDISEELAYVYRGTQETLATVRQQIRAQHNSGLKPLFAEIPKAAALPRYLPPAIRHQAMLENAREDLHRAVLEEQMLWAIRSEFIASMQAGETLQQRLDTLTDRLEAQVSRVLALSAPLIRGERERDLRGNAARLSFTARVRNSNVLWLSDDRNSPVSIAIALNRKLAQAVSALQRTKIEMHLFRDFLTGPKTSTDDTVEASPQFHWR